MGEPNYISSSSHFGLTVHINISSVVPADKGPYSFSEL